MANDLYNISLHRIDGTPATLEPYRGRVLLLVNTASQCGLTPQYNALEALYQRFKEDGFFVLGFPSNDFSAQEPGTNEEISRFCATQFHVSFPMFAKIPVVGKNRHPLYNALTAARPTSVGDSKQKFIEGLVNFGATINPEPEVLWNFEKFLVSRHGEIVARFSPNVEPDDPKLVKAIETELAKK
ncbi:MAG: glutathione peroxidase [Acidobacteria bacterium]|nr:glutathione peroxidase [Acidobacteriota bacterium]